MKPVIEENTKEFIRNLVANKGRGYAEDEVMDNLFEIGAYYSWGEENYGKHCRDNTVQGFLEVLKALLEASNEKEIRLSWADIEAVAPEDYSMIRLLADRGFPVDDTFSFALKPKAGLKYFEYHDHKTGDVVVQWRED